MIRTSRFAPLVAACALMLAVGVPAHAQFGGLMSKAKEKVADKAKENVGPVAPGEQLNEDLLGKVITGAQAADRVLAERDNAQAAREARNKELSVLSDKNGPVHQAYNEGSSKISDCRSSSFNNLQDVRNERIKKKTESMRSDPAMMGKMQLIVLKYAKQMSEAQQKQDPVALTKVQTDMMREMSGEDIFAELKKDTVATDSKCGKLPKMPASLVQEEQLRKDVSVADDSIRTLEAKAVNRGAQASGLEQVRYLQLKERALSIMNRMDGKGAAVRYGDEEVAVVKKRIGDLEKVKRAL